MNAVPMEDAPGMNAVSLADAGRRAWWRRFQIWLVIVTVCIAVGLSMGAVVMASLRLTRSVRSDQLAALLSNGGRPKLALRHHVTMAGDSAPRHLIKLFDGSTVVLEPGGRVTYLTPMVVFEAPSRYVIIDGGGALDLRTRWIVTTKMGTVALTPGRYIVEVPEHAVPGDSGMLMTVVTGAADAWPLYGNNLRVVHVEAGYSLWLPRSGPVPPPYKRDAR